MEIYRPLKNKGLTRRQFIGGGAAFILTGLLEACKPFTLETPIPPLTPIAAKRPDSPEELYQAAVEVVFFAQRLLKEGMLQAPTFSLPSEAPVHIILIPKTNEVDKNLIDLEYMATLATFFENQRELKYEGHLLQSRRPERQQILLTNRAQGVPPSLHQLGEVTVRLNPEGNSLITVIDLQGPKKELGDEYTLAWSEAQAICLGYTFNSPNSDPVCNVLSANIAAGWLNLDSKGKWINSLGSTSLSGKTSGTVGEAPYKFIPELWQYFRGEALAQGRP